MRCRAALAAMVLLVGMVREVGGKHPHQSGQCVRLPWKLPSGICSGFSTRATEAGLSSCSADDSVENLKTLYYSAAGQVEEADCKALVLDMCKRIGAHIKPGVCLSTMARKEKGFCGLLFKQLLGECRGDYDCMSSSTRSGLDKAQDRLLESAAALCDGVDYDLLNVILALKWHDETLKRKHPPTPALPPKSVPAAPSPPPPATHPQPAPAEDPAAVLTTPGAPVAALSAPAGARLGGAGGDMRAEGPAVVDEPSLFNATAPSTVEPANGRGGTVIAVVACVVLVLAAASLPGRLGGADPEAYANARHSL